MRLRNGLEVLVGDLWEYSSKNDDTPMMFDDTPMMFLVIGFEVSGAREGSYMYMAKTFMMNKNYKHVMSFMQEPHKYRLVARLPEENI